MWRHNYVIDRNEYLIFTFSESINLWVYSLQFLFKSTNNSWIYERKCEWVFFFWTQCSRPCLCECETWHLRPICSRLHSRIWASPTPYQNLVMPQDAKSRPFPYVKYSKLSHMTYFRLNFLLWYLTAYLTVCLFLSCRIRLIVSAGFWCIFTVLFIE